MMWDIVTAKCQKGCKIRNINNHNIKRFSEKTIKQKKSTNTQVNKNKNKKKQFPY